MVIWSQVWRRGPLVTLQGRLLAACVALLLCQCTLRDDLHTYRGLQPTIPDAAQPTASGPLFVNLPVSYTAPLYLSPIEGGLVLEWPGGTPLTSLGTRFDDGNAGWLLVRDPSGNTGWMAELFLDAQFSAADPPGEQDDDYLGPVYWVGDIVYCVNPSGGPPGLDGSAFVALVDRAAARWQDVGEHTLPLVSRGRCENAPALGDGVKTIGWVDDIGLVIAAQTWPNADHDAVTEMDIRVSRGYFQRLQARDASKTLDACVFSTLVHEFGHLLGLDHPRSRALPSSMQSFGASRCDKGQPTALDKANLLRRYAPDRVGLP
jgi:hypothetical protein